MGLNEHHLIKSSKIVKAVGGFVMTCLGWIPIEFRIGNRTSKQALYICEKVDRIYFSRSGCVEVGIISREFPYPMEEMNVIDTSTSEAKPEAQSSKIGEMARESPPPRPKELPYPATVENVDRLKQYILDSFASSAFNNSRPFPVITGPPGHIHLKEGAVPYARHIPIPVPFHLRDATKEGLDSDVERSIIKPVPVGTPTDWCATMVVAVKKNGKIRRMLDLQ